MLRIVDFLGMWMPNPIHAPPTEQFHNTIAAIQSGNPLECASSHNIIKDAGPVSLAVLDVSTVAPLSWIVADEHHSHSAAMRTKNSASRSQTYPLSFGGLL